MCACGSACGVNTTVAFRVTAEGTHRAAPLTERPAGAARAIRGSRRGGCGRPLGRVAVVPGVARKSMLPRGTAFSVCACACARVCGRVRGVRVSLQSRKHWCIPFILSMLNKPGFVMDNTFFFLFFKKEHRRASKIATVQKKCACVRVYLYIYIFIMYQPETATPPGETPTRASGGGCAWLARFGFCRSVRGT